MKTKLLLSAVTALLAGVSAASAADLAARPYTKAPPAPMVAIYNWTGFYIGGNVGYGWGDESVGLGPTNNAASIAFFNGTFPAFIPNSVKPDANGILGGGQIGYNWQAGSFVYGLEADIQASDVKGTVNTSVLPGPIVSSTSQRLDWFGTVRGRAGVAAGNTLLLYVTGGLAYGSVNHQFSASNNAGSFNTTNATSTNAGWTAGAGLEWAFAPQWSIKGEYLYVDLGNRTYSTIPSGTTPAGASIDSSFRDKFSVARVGVNFKFGGPVVAKY